MKSNFLYLKSFLFYIIIFGTVCTVPKIMGQDFFNDLDQEFPGPDSLSIAVFGDIMVHDTQLESAWNEKLRDYNFRPVFTEIKDLLSAADLTIGNLETTLPGQNDLFGGYPRFGAPDALAMALKEAGIDIVTTANNHACDTGYPGVIHTIEALEQYGLLHLGTYQNEADYQKNRIFLLERNGIKLTCLNYTYALNGNPIPEGTRINLLRKKIMAADLLLAREQKPDAIIVLLHCGTEYQRLPDDYQKNRVDFLFREGADIVLISHPHVLQPFQIKTVTDKYGVTKNRLVAYSLGNFLSNQRERYRDGGIIFNFNLKKDRDGLISIENIHCDPIWVYVDRSHSKRSFMILPVENYLKNNQFIRLSKSAYQKMMTFYHDTVEHLEQSMADVKIDISKAEDH